jgi:hypothetical protein
MARPKTKIARPGKGTKTIDGMAEERLQSACQDCKLGIYKTAIAASKAYEAPYATLVRRVNGQTQSKQVAHNHQLILTKAEEGVLVEWLKYLGMPGHPPNRRTLRPKVEAPIPETQRGKLTASKSWIKRFLKRRPDIKLGRSGSLDPKRAKAFNFTAVCDHFKRLMDHMREYDIPWENVYNMDEKGIQMGGGRKGKGEKFFFAIIDKSQRRLKSDGLQLVTIIEVVCADRAATIMPGFVFAGKAVREEWMCVPGAA